MTVELLTLKNHFIVIDSPVDFQLVANPVLINNNGVYSFPDGRVKGTDVCSRRAGAWQIDAWTLLGKRDFPLRPAFTMCIVYDETGLFSGESVSIQYSDINLGEGIAGVNGQLIAIDARDFTPITSRLDDILSKMGTNPPLVPFRFQSYSPNLTVGDGFLGSSLLKNVPSGFYYSPSFMFSIGNADNIQFIYRFPFGGHLEIVQESDAIVIHTTGLYSGGAGRDFSIHYNDVYQNTPLNVSSSLTSLYSFVWGYLYRIA